MSEQATTPEATTPAVEAEAAVAAQVAAFEQKAKNKLGPCECQNWEIGTTTDAEGDGDEPDVTIITTGCDKVTKRLFAQGHDAKLKSLFIRAGVEGLEVRWGRNFGVVHSTDAEGAAARFGFGHQVQKAIVARLDKLARGGKAIPAAPKAVAAEAIEGSEEGDTPTIPQAPADQDGWTDEAQQATDELLAEATGEVEPQPEPQGPGLTKGKVGRWIYEGRVAADGTFIYESGNGETKTAPAGKWAPVEG